MIESHQKNGECYQEPDFTGECNGDGEEIANNSKLSVSDLAIKIRNQGGCSIEVTLDIEDDDDNSFTMNLDPNRSYAFQIPAGGSVFVACNECPEKKCAYSFEIA